MKKIAYWIMVLLFFSGLVCFLSLVDIQKIKVGYIGTLWSNLTFISTILFSLIPLLLIILLLVLALLKKWAFRVEKLSIGGFNILFDNPNQLFKRQVSSYLDTKRTLFIIDFEHDNIKETLDSYFDVYKFLRDEIKILGDTKKKRKNSKNSKLYNLANEMIKELNLFLTTHQSNYRRWYTYLEKHDERNFYLKPIGELQNDYHNYKQLKTDFKKLNKFFIEEVAKEFDVEIEKWDVKNA
ncbi:hypothetical protein CON43_01160 [Bacillus cereus]|uniref:hypothetical protein n=1 Tax=Bacillus cereus group TaxID=86661 RepID=UPI000BECBEF9|nr:MULTISPECIES: hypothetical protein [Bacillus cereus group]MBE5090634.1 hypothetical protein [Bacillus thuringiensis]PED91588.1 hypothetical protein CON43_01160 [Bacillus cereus]